MRTASDTKLDEVTPGWPVVRVSLADPASVAVNGVSTPLTSTDPQGEAVGYGRRQAQTLNRAVRMTVTGESGIVQQLIVKVDGSVVILDPPKRTSGKAAARKAAGPVKPKARIGPPRWVVLSIVVFLLVALGVLGAAIVHGNSRTASAAAETVTTPVPPSGALYTDLAPPGWSQQAKWVVPIVDGTTPATDPATGMTAAVTPDDRSTTDTAAQRTGANDEWLSILGPNGATRWAFSLAQPPVFGPVITRIDGAEVAFVADSTQVRYWSLTSGAETDVPLPEGGAQFSAAGESVLVAMPQDQLGYFHGGALQVVEMLPHTDAGIALDGAVVVTQADNGALWTLTPTGTPTVVRPAAPRGARAVSAVLGVSATRVLIAWTPTAVDPQGQAVIVAGYDRRTGRLLASTTTATGLLGQSSAAVVSDDTAGTTGVGSVVLSTAGRPAVWVVPGFTATSAAGRVYGTTAQGGPMYVSASGAGVPLPVGTLVPASSGGSFLPVVSQARIYALIGGQA